MKEGNNASEILKERLAGEIVTFLLSVEDFEEMDKFILNLATSLLSMDKVLIGRAALAFEKKDFFGALEILKANAFPTIPGEDGTAGTSTLGTRWFFFPFSFFFESKYLV